MQHHNFSYLNATLIIFGVAFSFTFHFRVDNLYIFDINLDKIGDSCYNEDGKYNFLKMFTASKEELEELVKEGDSFMKEIKKNMDELSSDNFFENYISVEEDERKIRNTYYVNGEEQGKADGIKIGKENALIETAKRFLSLGLSVKEVAKGTGLTENKVKTLL